MEIISKTIQGFPRSAILEISKDFPRSIIRISKNFPRSTILEISKDFSKSVIPKILLDLFVYGVVSLPLQAYNAIHTQSCNCPLFRFNLSISCLAILCNMMLPTSSILANFPHYGLALTSTKQAIWYQYHKPVKCYTPMFHLYTLTFIPCVAVS